MSLTRQILILHLCFASFVLASEPSETKFDPLAILQSECASCHNETKRKGGLLINSRESLLEGGDSDAAIVPGKADDSLLFETLFPNHDSHMPPKSQLGPREIAALEEWINDGAPWDAEHWANLSLPKKQEVAPGVLPASYFPILTLALSPDQKLLVVGRGRFLDWYRVEENKEKAGEKKLSLLKTTPAHDDAVQSLAFSPDGSLLVSGGFRSLRFWDPATPGKTTREDFSDPFLGRLTALLFLDKGKRLLVADSLPAQVGTLHDITLDSMKVNTQDLAHLDTIFSLSLSPDGKYYATASADKLITVRDSSTHKIHKRLEGHIGYVLTTVFSPEGKRLASAGDDAEIKIWEVDTEKKIGAFSSLRSGPFYGLDWIIEPDNLKKKEAEKDKAKAAEINTDLLFSVAQSGKTSTFYDLKEHEGAQTSTGAKERGGDSAGTPLFALAVDPESRWCYAGGEDGKLRVWDEKGKLRYTLDPPPSTPAPVASTNE